MPRFGSPGRRVRPLTSRPRRRTGRVLLAGILWLGGPPDGPAAASDPAFRRIATFPAYLNTDVGVETVSEIVDCTADGMLLVYADSRTGHLGFVDITAPERPRPAGVVAVPGEPTSVAISGRHALATVNTSESRAEPSGSLEVIDVVTRAVVRSVDLGGQPDSIAVSPDGRFAVIAVENERDEELGSGAPPQPPPGFVVIVDVVGPPSDWGARRVDLVGVADRYPEDPEPEFVDVSPDNVAAVTLQENNHVVLIRLADGAIVGDFAAGTASLDRVDTLRNGLIEQEGSLEDVPREPDAVAWLSRSTLATADEGDLLGGTRGFTTWASDGTPLFRAHETVETALTRLGHYPEHRAQSRGNEPEGLEFARFGEDELLFVTSERSNVVLVYELPPEAGAGGPVLRQVLPTGLGPEGLRAIPQRDLLVVASEVDARRAGVRAGLTIYERADASTYPTVRSADRANGLPIPWGALSGLAAAPGEPGTLYAVCDGVYRRNRILAVEIDRTPAVIVGERRIVDARRVLGDALVAIEGSLPDSGGLDFEALRNEDGTVNLDPEGLAIDDEGFFWLACEGAGRLVAGRSDPDRPFRAPNLLVRVTPDGLIRRVVPLPPDLAGRQDDAGFEGVAVLGRHVFVAFQRPWPGAGDPHDRARIGRFDRATGEWAFVHYPLDAPASPDRGRVGLSELTHAGGGTLVVIERDDLGGPDAAIKRLYAFRIDDAPFRAGPPGGALAVVRKTLVRDLLAERDFEPTGGPVPAKLEGLAVLADGSTLIVNDNDGVNGSSGETQLLRLGDLFD